MCRGARQLGGAQLDQESSITVDTLLGDRRQELPSICARNIAQALDAAGLDRWACCPSWATLCGKHFGLFAWFQALQLCLSACAALLDVGQIFRLAGQMWSLFLLVFPCLLDYHRAYALPLQATCAGPGHEAVHLARAAGSGTA